LVRIHACHAWGRGFESRPDRKKNKKAQTLRLSFFVFVTFKSHSVGVR
jgi:hypothetical protein